MWYTPERILAVTLYQILKVILGNSQWDVWDPELQSLGVLGVFIILLPPQDCPRAKTQGNGKDISRPDGILNLTSVGQCTYSVSFQVDMNRDSVISITLGATHHRAITDHWQLCDNRHWLHISQSPFQDRTTNYFHWLNESPIFKQGSVLPLTIFLIRPVDLLTYLMWVSIYIWRYIWRCRPRNLPSNAWPDHRSDPDFKFLSMLTCYFPFPLLNRLL